MPWNTVDMMTMPPRAVEAGDLQGREIAQHQHALDQTAAAAQEQTRLKNQHTVETQRSETEEYDMDEGNAAGRGYAGNNGRRKKKEKEEEAPMAPKSDSMFDIMV